MSTDELLEPVEVPQRDSSFLTRSAMRLGGLDERTWQEFSLFLATARNVESQANGAKSSPNSFFGSLSLVRDQLGRIQKWRDLADEAWGDNDPTKACAYELRIMRLRGLDTEQRLVKVQDTLRELEFPSAVDAAEVLYGNDPANDRVERTHSLLNETSGAHFANTLPEDGELHDCRTNDKPRVSLIVSLYNAESKLKHFLEKTARQSLCQRREIELIFVDSDSPTNERAMIDRLASELGMSYVYFRTARREPIALAWNRGLALTRAPYVAFWGVDEGAIDVGLEKLADFLDEHSSVDWVQSDAILYDVADDGTKLRAARKYSRRSFSPELIYVRHQYLNYVGGLYRRSIHDRCGYYDRRLKAAGDTEFKHRVLPNIEVAALPQVLGEYMNYAEERLTEHPRAEIEDIAAYELHHSQAGVRYAFPNATAAELWGLLCISLKHRPSMHEYFSSDIECAANVAAVLEATGEVSDTQRKLIRQVKKCLANFRLADEPKAGWLKLAGVGWSAYQLQRRFRSNTPERFQPACWFFNDVRFSRYYRPWN